MRKRYIIDRTRGPGGGHRDVRHLYGYPHSAQLASKRQYQNDGPRVLEVDIDELPEHGAPDWKLYEHAERRLFHWTEEEQRLRPSVRGGEPLDDSRRKLIDGVLDAARDWRREYEKRCKRKSFQPTQAETLLFHALVHLDDGRPCACGKAEHPDGCEDWCDGGK